MTTEYYVTWCLAVYDVAIQTRTIWQSSVSQEVTCKHCRILIYLACTGIFSNTLPTQPTKPWILLTRSVLHRGHQHTYRKGENDDDMLVQYPARHPHLIDLRGCQAMASRASPFGYHLPHIVGAISGDCAGGASYNRTVPRQHRPPHSRRSPLLRVAHRPSRHLNAGQVSSAQEMVLPGSAGSEIQAALAKLLPPAAQAARSPCKLRRRRQSPAG